MNKLIELSSFIDKIEPGDILIHLPGREGQYGHCRIVTGLTTGIIKKYTLADAYYHVLGYTCNKLTLSLIILLITYSWGYDGISLVRVNATTEQKQNAVDFAKLQIGKFFDMPYDRGAKNYNPEDPNDSNANQWYCSELPWAAYYNCNNSFPEEKTVGGYIYGEGIDIDSNGWEIDCVGFLGKEYALVHPIDIINDDDVQIIDTWIRPDRE